jgi:hypothetical protein
MSLIPKAGFGRNLTLWDMSIENKDTICFSASITTHTQILEFKDKTNP